MFHNIKLSDSTIANYTFAKIIQALLNPIEMLELEDVIYQLGMAELVHFEVDEHLLSTEILYDKNDVFFLESIGRSICNSNQFELVIDVQKTQQKDKKLLSLNFLNHNLDFLITEVLSGFLTKEIPLHIVEKLQDLEFLIPEKNKKVATNNDIDKLLKWIDTKNIKKEVIPHSKKELLSLEFLNLSNIELYEIPKHIRVLKNLKKLYIANCRLVKLPLEIFSLPNLKVLWAQNNHLSTIPKAINNLKDLKDFVVYDNNIQNLPPMNGLEKLSFIALHRNLISDKTIDIFLKNIPTHVQYSIYEQKDLPFLIEPLSFVTLKEAEKLRDRIFKDDLEDIERDLLFASLNPERYKKVYDINEIETVNYWVAKDKTSKQIIGLTGMYREKTDDEDECWLGWFCIDEKYRGKALGKQLLEFSIEQAKMMEKNYLHVYTYKAKRFQRAIAMYRKYGFKEYQEEKDDARTIYLKMQLATNRNFVDINTLTIEELREIDKLTNAELLKFNPELSHEKDMYIQENFSEQLSKLYPKQLWKH